MELVRALAEEDKRVVSQACNMRLLREFAGNAVASLGGLRGHAGRGLDGAEALGGLGFLLGEICSTIDRMERAGKEDRLRKVLNSFLQKAMERGEYELVDSIERAMSGELEAIDAPDLPDATAQDLWHQRGN